MAGYGTIALLRQELRVTGVLLVAMLSGWVFLVWAMVDGSHPLAKLMMPMSPAWSVANVLGVFAMWAIMMLAMMLPSAIPMILSFVNLSRQKHRVAHGWIFVGAYLLIWTVFSAFATLMQWVLQVTSLISPMMVSQSIWLTATLLMVVGLTQFTALKQACLRHCRTPMGYLLTEWKQGAYGAWRMGFKHGLYCLGCCWAMMGLLFVTGVMNLVWVAALTVVIIIEKIHPAGEKLGKYLGAILILFGIWKIAQLSVM